jgi:hypothetical protein
LYRQIETRLTELVGAADSLLLSTLTHIHASVIPVASCSTGGIYLTLAFYPGVPREEVGFRIQVTAANTDDQVSELLAALDRLADVVPLRQV